MQQKILLLDDEEPFLETLADVMERLGFEAACCPTLRQAEQALCSSALFSFALFDVDVAGQESFSLIRAFAMERVPKLPFGVMSAAHLEGVPADIAERAVALLQKPISRTALQAMLREARLL